MEYAKTTGTEINYYYVCKRKLWLFSHDINMEQNSIRVEIGRENHESSFEREKKEILIDGAIVVDFIGKEMVIHETKVAKSMEKAARMQLLFYLYFLEKKGLENLSGTIHYMEEHCKEEIHLSDETRKEIEKAINDIKEINNLEFPPYQEKMKICPKCSYYELCFC